MSLIDKIRRQWCVYWEWIGQDAHGKDVYAEPIEIKVRWEDRQERDISPLTGEEVMVRSTIYVDRDMTLGGVLWLGLLVDAPNTPPEHNKIKVVRSIPNKRALKFVRTVRI